MGLSYFAIMVMVIIALGVAGFMLFIAFFLGPRRPGIQKMSVYECGIEPKEEAQTRIPVKFFLIAILFILFDIEVIFLYPWAVLFRQLGWFGLIEMLFFLMVLGLGYIYLYKKGAFEWD